MKILITADAASYYKNTALHKRIGFEQNYYDELLKIQGKTLEVDTDSLFSDQFNVKNMRIYKEYVAKVVSDRRVGAYRDHYNGSTFYSVQDYAFGISNKSYIVKLVRHPNPFTRRSGVCLWEVYIYDEKSVNKYNQLCGELGTRPDKI